MFLICHNKDYNITPGEREAIKSLRADKDIMILPADKGRAVVVMDKKEYKEKANKLLSDEKTYKKEKKDPTRMPEISPPV